jgi:hypothetical protein
VSTGGPTQDTASFLSSLLNGLLVCRTRRIPGKTANRPVNRTLQVPPHQAGTIYSPILGGASHMLLNVVVNSPASLSGGPGFNSRPGDLLY